MNNLNHSFNTIPQSGDNFFSINFEKTKATPAALNKIKRIIIKEGEKERLHLNELTSIENGIYQIAIKTLDPNKQLKIRNTGYKGLNSYFWKPMTIKNGEKEVIILVNIKSAIKRLNPLNFTPAQVIDAIQDGTLLNQIETKIKTKINETEFNSFKEAANTLNFSEKDNPETFKKIKDIKTTHKSSYEDAILTYEIESFTKAAKVLNFPEEFNQSTFNKINTIKDNL